MNKQVRSISIYNKACKIIQCFKCYYYKHITIQCIKEKKCDYYVESHAINFEACMTSFKFKCCLCEEDYKSWQKKYLKKRKEI